MRKLINRLFHRHDCRDELASKIARVKGELAEVQHLVEHWQGKNFDPHTVPGCWKHAQKVQCLHDLHEAYTKLTTRLVQLQNRDTTAYDRELSNDVR